MAILNIGHPSCIVTVKMIVELAQLVLQISQYHYLSSGFITGLVRYISSEPEQ
ncbi:hypothetical protein A2U01_0038379, partial [Trifolium medium]|nr:hypothetical protein [Trifolium medium]